MECPECPVCLQSYDNDSATPRVLSCGHTTCEPCLASLPQRFPLTIRCPICNHLIKFPSPSGPSSLPKNIDLLRFVDLIPHTPIKKKVPPQLGFPFSTRAWSGQFYDSWRKWILDMDDVSTTDAGRVFSGKEVGLFKIGELKEQGKCSSSTCVEYTTMILNYLQKMSDKAREEISLLLKITWKNLYYSRLHGIWNDPEDRSLYLVFEKLNNLGLLELSCDECLPNFVINAMHVCEAIISTHYESAVIGILGVSCFGFDHFGRLSLNMKEVLEYGREINKRLSDEEELSSLIVWLFENEIYVSPELLKEIRENSINSGKGRKNVPFMEMEVWSLGCFLIRLLLGKNFTDEMSQFLRTLLLECTDETIIFHGITEKIRIIFTAEMKDEFHSLKEILCSCVDFDSSKRPLVGDVWKIIRGTIFKAPHVLPQQNPLSHCMNLSELCQSNASKGIQTCNTQKTADFITSLVENRLISNDIAGLSNYTTCLTIGESFLFSSSYDKLVHVWSLQDYSHVHAFKGHNSKVMAVAYIPENQAIVSGDGEGGIFLWSTKVPLSKEPLKSWYERKDWRFSGIHSLAATDTFVYTGSGDRTVKAWSLKVTSFNPRSR